MLLLWLTVFHSLLCDTAHCFFQALQGDEILACITISSHIQITGHTVVRTPYISQGCEVRLTESLITPEVPEWQSGDLQGPHEKNRHFQSDRLYPEPPAPNLGALEPWRPGVGNHDGFLDFWISGMWILS